MRTTGYTNPQIAYMFAMLDDNAPERAEGLDGSRMFFRGRVLYSHGTHFTLAVVDFETGIALVRHRDECAECSVSTRTHHGITVSALNKANWIVVEVPNLSPMGFHEVNLQRLTDKREDFRGKEKRARADHMKSWWREQTENTALQRSIFYAHYVRPARSLEQAMGRA